MAGAAMIWKLSLRKKKYDEKGQDANILSCLFKFSKDSLQSFKTANGVLNIIGPQCVCIIIHLGSIVPFLLWFLVYNNDQ